MICVIATRGSMAWLATPYPHTYQATSHMARANFRPRVLWKRGWRRTAHTLVGRAGGRWTT